MISIICIYTSKTDFQNIFFKTLEKQNIEYELFSVNISQSEYKSPAQAFNDLAIKAKGDYLLFTNQAIVISSKNWLKDMEAMVASLDNLGVAGVCGMSFNGKKWVSKIRTCREFYDEPPFTEIKPITEPEIIHTLDDSLLIIPRTVFKKYKFNEERNHSLLFGADYSLNITQKGLSAYCLPLQVKNTGSLIDRQIWESEKIHKAKKALFQAHRKIHNRIYTYLGAISPVHLVLSGMLTFFLHRCMEIHFRIHKKVWTKLFKNCESVLNIGCGHDFPLQARSIPFSVGVEIYGPSLKKSRELKIHTHYIYGDARSVNFKPGSVDTVTLIEVLEHLTKEEGIELIKKMETWAVKRVIITTPNGYVEQDEYDNNPYQIHRSGWSVSDFKHLGYTVKGILGIKIFLSQFARVKYHPVPFWTGLIYLTGLLTCIIPRIDYRIIAYKDIN